MKLYEQFNFCPRCRGDFKKEQQDFFECQNCHYKFYVNPVPANGVLLEKSDGTILLIERRFEPSKGMLDVPGGFVDLNETAEESMAREVQEELQLIMKPEDFTYLCGPYGTYKFQDDIMPTLCLIYIAKLPENQTPISSDDAGKIHYFKASEIPLNQIAFDGVRTAIEFYQKSH